MDTNGDGRLDRAEIDAAPQALAKLDKNADGRITADEVQIGRGRGEGEGNAGANVVEDNVKALMAFDKDGDGKLSKAELPERFQGLFARGDENGDGVLTAEEIRKMAAAQTLLAQAASSRPAPVQAASSGGSWNPAYELAVNVEIPQNQGSGARRPYIAIWIEDKDRFPVRTLAVLVEKTRWLNELRAWYRDDRLRAMSEGGEILHSVSSATRSPGKYTFKWDGKDNAGKPVKAGTYTVMVEAAREHGGYSLDRHEMNFNGEPAQALLPPDKELGAVGLDYHKVAR